MYNRFRHIIRRHNIYRQTRIKQQTQTRANNDLKRLLTRQRSKFCDKCKINKLSQRLRIIETEIRDEQLEIIHINLISTAIALTTCILSISVCTTSRW